MVAENTPKPEKKENPLLKLLLEVGPLVIFFFAYNRSEQVAAWFGLGDMQPILVATAVFIPAMGLALLVSWMMQGRLPVMPMVSFILVVIFGGLTLYLQDETFIKMKPTILNFFFAGALLGGLAFGKLFLKTIFEDGWEIIDEGWRKLTIRWALFFIFMALLNEVIWRNFSEEFWVNFKVWGNLPITMIFAVTQFLMIQKYAYAPDRLGSFASKLTKGEGGAALTALRDNSGIDPAAVVAALWHGSEGRSISAEMLQADAPLHSEPSGDLFNDDASVERLKSLGVGYDEQLGQGTRADAERNIAALLGDAALETPEIRALLGQIG